MGVNDGCFGVKPLDKVPLLGRVDVLLTLDDDNLVSPDGVRQCLDVRIYERFSGDFTKRGLKRVDCIPLISSKSSPVTTAPKSCFSFTVFVIGVTLNVGVGGIALGDMVVRLI